MKKNLLLLLLVSFTVVLSGQYVSQLPVVKKTVKYVESKEPIGLNTKEYRVAGDTLYFYDFNDTTGWTTGLTGNTVNDWHFGTPTQNMLDYLGDLEVMFQTSGYPALYIDGITFLLDSNFQESNAYVESPLLDFTGTNHITLQMKNLYKPFNEDSCFIEFSRDGGITWPDSLSIYLYDYLGGCSYAPLDLWLNISAYVGNLPNAKLRFRWYGPQEVSGQGMSGGGYGWQIDDVLIYEAVQNDILVNYYKPGFYYKNIPYFVECDADSNNVIEELPMPAMFDNYRIGLFNSGVNTASNVQSNIKITNEDQSKIYYDADSDTVISSIIQFETATIHEYLNVPFSWNNWSQGDSTLDDGAYQILLNVFSDSTDEITGNNLDVYNFTISSNYFAVDNGDETNFESTNLNSQPENGDIYGVIYHNALNKAHVESVQFFITDQSTVDGYNHGATVKAQLYKQIDYDNYDLILESDEFIVSYGHINNWVEIPFNTNGTSEYLINSKYLAAIKVVDLNNQEFYIGNDLSVDHSTCYTVWYDQAFGIWRHNLYNSIHPVIRLLYNSSMSINDTEIKNKISVFPNPSRGEIFFENMDNTDVMIYDLYGQLVLKQSQIKNRMDISGLPDGHYIIKAVNNKSVCTEKIILVR